MNNIPENEKKLDSAENAAEAENSFDEAEFSTVFGDPRTHKRTAPKKNKKRLITLLAGFLGVAVLGTVLWAVIKYIPEMVDDTTYESPYLEETEVKSEESDNLSAVTVTNANGTVKFYSSTETVETDSSVEGTASTAEVVTWHIDGVDDSYVSTSSIATFIGQVGRISVVKEVTDMTEADCGIDNPTATAEVVNKDGTAFTVTLGKAMGAGNYYGKMSDTGKLYIVTSGYAEEIIGVSALDFSATTTTPAFTLPDGADEYMSEDGTLAYFDKLTVKSAAFDDTLVFETNTNKELANMLGYVVTSPSTRIAQNAEYLVAIFQSGIGVEGTYAFGATSENIKKYGLDNPDFEATLYVMDETMTYKFKLQDDGSYAVVADGADVISKVSASTNLSGDSTNPILLSDMLNYDVTDFYAYWITLYNIADLSNLTITVEDKVYSFDIAANPDTESEDSYVIKVNGTQIDCQSFQYLYQFCVSMQCSDFTVEKLTAEPEIKFEFAFNDESFDNTVVEFTRAGASRYQYSIAGIDMGKTTSAEMNKFIKYLEKVAAGEIIDEIV